MFAQNDLTFEILKLRKFALRLTRNNDDADDLVQSTCLRALEKADYFENGSNLFSWTSKIMYNLFVSGYHRRVKFETQYDPETYLEKQSIKPEQDTAMEFSDVQRAMNKLNKKHYNIIILICIEGRRYQEVSEILDIPVDTVRSRLSRAREQLQLHMNHPSERYMRENMSAVPAYIAARALLKRA